MGAFGRAIRSSTKCHPVGPPFIHPKLLCFYTESEQKRKQNEILLTELAHRIEQQSYNTRVSSVSNRRRRLSLFDRREKTMIEQSQNSLKTLTLCLCLCVCECLLVCLRECACATCIQSAKKPNQRAPIASANTKYHIQFIIIFLFVWRT